MHKAVTGRVEAKKLLSRRRQLEYRQPAPLPYADSKTQIISHHFPGGSHIDMVYI